MRRVKNFLWTLFWIDRLDTRVAETQSFVFRFLRWSAIIAMVVYVSGLLHMLIHLAIGPSMENLIGLIFVAVLFPIAFRLVMGFQIKFHSLWVGKAR